MNYKDIAIRATRTFIQAFLATLSVQVVSIKDWQTARPVLVGAIAAGVSAIWNSLDQIIKNKK